MKHFLTATDIGTTSTKLCWWVPWAITTYQIENSHSWTDDMISRNFCCKRVNEELKYYDEILQIVQRN